MYRGVTLDFRGFHGAGPWPTLWLSRMSVHEHGAGGLVARGVHEDQRAQHARLAERGGGQGRKYRAAFDVLKQRAGVILLRCG